jgi:hypothetical protein
MFTKKFSPKAKIKQNFVTFSRKFSFSRNSRKQNIFAKIYKIDIKFWEKFCFSNKFSRKCSLFDKRVNKY